MSETERVIRAISKRRSTKKRGRKSFVRPSTAMPTEAPPLAGSGLAEMIKKSLAEKTPALIIQQPASAAPQPSLGDLIGQLVVDAAKAAYNEKWKKTDPESYLLYQATWALAPNWPPEWGWLPNFTAIGAVIRGASRIADKSKR